MQRGSGHWLVILEILPCGLRLLVRGWYLCMSVVRYGVKMVDRLWAWCWRWSHSYLSEEMRVGEAVVFDGRCIPILYVSVLFHDVWGGTIVVWADVVGWESLSGSLFVSSILHNAGIWRLGSLGGEAG